MDGIKIVYEGNERLEEAFEKELQILGKKFLESTLQYARLYFIERQGYIVLGQVNSEERTIRGYMYIHKKVYPVIIPLDTVELVLTIATVKKGVNELIVRVEYSG